MNSNSKNERSLLPLVVLAGVVSAPIIFIAGLIFGTELNASIVLTADSLSSWVGAIATVSIAVLTFILAKETWHLRNAQIAQLTEIRKESMRPNIVVSIQPSIVDMNFLDVVIQNLGKGIACNVQFSFKNEDGTVATTENNQLVKRLTKLSLFENGCSSLGLGQTIKSYLFSFRDLEKEVGKENLFKQRVQLEIYFEDAEGAAYNNIININFSDMKGISYLGGSSDPIYSIFKELEKLRKTFEPVFKSGQKKLNVDAYNSEDREIEREQTLKRHKEMMESYNQQK